MRGLALLLLLASGIAFADPVTPESQQPVTPPADAPTEVKISPFNDEAIRQGGNPIERVLASGLMKGYPDGKFHAEGKVTRAELAHILVNTFDIEKRNPDNVTPEVVNDVAPDFWAAKDIETVLRTGVMKGYHPGQFYPHQQVTRAEAYAIFAQAYGVYSLDEPAVDEILGHYPDSKQLPDWSRKAMATALEARFVNTNEKANHIDPNRPMTRGDLAFALNRYLALKGRDGDGYQK